MPGPLSDASVASESVLARDEAEATVCRLHGRDLSNIACNPDSLLSPNTFGHVRSADPS